MSGARRPRPRLAVLAAVAALALGACSQEVRQADVEHSIRDAMDNQGVALTDVSCPSGVPPELDAFIICDVEMDGVTSTGLPIDRIRVVVTRVEGDEVRYRLEPLVEGQPDDTGDTDESTGTGG